MKLFAKFVRKSYDENNDVEFTLKVSSGYYKRLISSLEKDKVYDLKIEKPKSQRTIKQNDKLWAIIGDLAEETGNKTWDIYLELLVMAGARVDYLAVPARAIPMLRRGYRAVKPLYKIVVDNGLDLVNCKCYCGSSSLTTKEMVVLIDKALEYCELLGLETTYYKENY